MAIRLRQVLNNMRTTTASRGLVPVHSSADTAPTQRSLTFEHEVEILAPCLCRSCSALPAVKTCQIFAIPSPSRPSHC